MKKTIRILRTLLIAALVIAAVMILLRWKPLDDFLTSKIGRTGIPAESSDSLIAIEDYHGLLPEPDRPYVFSEGGRLFADYGGRKTDITPEGVAQVFYGPESGLSEKLIYRDHSCFDSATGRMLFVAEAQNVPMLFLADLRSGRSVCVSENVDSFLFAGHHPVFAEGYEKFNSLSIYRDGVKEKLFENARYYPVPEMDGIIALGADGRLSFYGALSGKTVVIAENAGAYLTHCPIGEDRLLVYCASGESSREYTVNIATGRTDRAEVDSVPDTCFSGGNAYLHDTESGTVTCAEPDGSRTRLFAEAGHIYALFSCETARGGDRETFDMLFATVDGLMRGSGDPSSQNVEKLCGFTGYLKMYSRYPWLISVHLAAGGDGAGNVYLLSIAGESWILNRKNPYSWMNRFSSYVYRLSYVSGGRARECGAPLTRTLALPRTVSGSNVLFESRYAGGEIRSLTTLREGGVTGKDLLMSDGAAAGTRNIVADISGGKLYITSVNDPRSYNSSVAFFEAEPESGKITEIKGKYHISFGHIYETEETK